jgi:hypothetical protein
MGAHIFDAQTAECLLVTPLNVPILQKAPGKSGRTFLPPTVFEFLNPGVTREATPFMRGHSACRQTVICDFAGSRRRNASPLNFLFPNRESD